MGDTGTVSLAAFLHIQLPFLGIKGFRAEAGKPCLLLDRNPACTEEIPKTLPRVPRAAALQGWTSCGPLKDLAGWEDNKMAVTATSRSMQPGLQEKKNI